MSVLALDLGGTKLASASFSSTGELMEGYTSPIGDRSGTDVGTLMTEHVRRMADLTGERATAIGVSIPGIYRHRKGTVWAPNIDGWNDFPLLDTLRTAFPGVPVAIDSDRACSMLGEQWHGNAQNCRDAIFMAVGTGIGVGILADGKIIRGAGDIAGAVGWLALQKPFEKKYISCGCFEFYASGAGIARFAEELLDRQRDYSGALRERAGRLTAHDIFTAHALGDPLAISVIDACIEFWGMATANLVSIFNPEKVIFGGGIFGPAVMFIPAIYEEASKWAQPISIQQSRFEPSALGPRAALFGAAYIAAQQLTKSTPS